MPNCKIRTFLFILDVYVLRHVYVCLPLFSNLSWREFYIKKNKMCLIMSPPPPPTLRIESTPGLRCYLLKFVHFFHPRHLIFKFLPLPPDLSLLRVAVLDEFSPLGLHLTPHLRHLKQTDISVGSHSVWTSDRPKPPRQGA